MIEAHVRTVFDEKFVRSWVAHRKDGAGKQEFVPFLLVAVARGEADRPSSAPWRAGQLPLETAREIAAKGGVVGLWALSIDVGRSPEAYAERLLQMVDWLGEDHVGFGTDINGLGPNAALRSYADVRRVVEHWQRKGIAERRIRKLACENYARVLKAAMSA